MMRFAVLSALLACALTAPLAAQADLPVRPEQVVRVRAPAVGLRERTVATVLEVRPDSLVLQTSRLDTIRGGAVLEQHRLALHNVWSLEVQEGRRSRLRGGVLGMVIGTGVGVGAAALHMRFSNRPGDVVPCNGPECPFPPEIQLRPYPRDRFVKITLVGTVLGTAAGSVFSGRRWRHVFPIAPAPGGVQVSGTIRF